MTIALTGNQQDLAEAVAGFTARHAPIAAARTAFGELAAGLPQPSWQALVRQGFHALHLPESAGGDGAGASTSGAGEDSGSSAGPSGAGSGLGSGSASVPGGASTFSAGAVAGTRSGGAARLSSARS